MNGENATAIIGATDVGTTLGILWRDFPEMERRGGYSGPFNTEAEAVQCANDWGAAWDREVAILRVERLSDVPEYRR